MKNLDFEFDILIDNLHDLQLRTKWDNPETIQWTKMHVEVGVPASRMPAHLDFIRDPPIFKWYMARLVVKKQTPKDMCYDEIGLCTQNEDTILVLTV